LSEDGASLCHDRDTGPLLACHLDFSRAGSCCRARRLGSHHLRFPRRCRAQGVPARQGRRPRCAHRRSHRNALAVDGLMRRTSRCPAGCGRLQPRRGYRRRAAISATLISSTIEPLNLIDMERTFCCPGKPRPVKVSREPIRGANAFRFPRTHCDHPGALVLVRDSPSDSAGPSQTPDSCLGVKGSPVQIRPSRPFFEHRGDHLGTTP
jgi:hypothetical protein